LGSSVPETSLLASTRSLWKKRWPTAAGILTVPVLLLVGWIDDIVDGVVVAQVLYLAWGVTRHASGRPGRLALQVIGVLIFGALNLYALDQDEPLVRYLLAAGWLGHAAWDVVHYRANEVVPRWWSEWCIALDVLLAVILVATPSLV
jgi:hypothetical protein